MIWLLILFLVVIHFLIGHFVVGLMFRFDRDGSFNPKTDTDVIGIASFLWPFIIIVMICIWTWNHILTPIGHKISKFNPFKIFRKVFYLGLQGNPWKSWQAYVARKSS